MTAERRVMVTGAGGYIGSILTRALIDRGDVVTAVDAFYFGRDTLPEESSRLRVLAKDVRDVGPEELEGVDAVIDLAALSNDPAGELDPSKTWSINHEARVRVAHLAKDAGASRYVLPSSCSIYGFREGVMDETSPVNPLTTYAEANYRAEQDTLPLANDVFCVAIARQATVYGASHRMRFDLAINGMTRGLFTSGVIPILRDGTQWRPFVHVKDTVRALIALMEAPAETVNGEIFNIGSDEQNVQVMPLAKSVATAVGLPFEFEWYGLPDHRSYQVSFRKAQEVLGFATRYTPEDGARETYEMLKDGTVAPDDPKTITVEWYKHLIATKGPDVL